MFEDLHRYKRILVTGPQRSGTTICARCIAEDTGHRYVDEEEIKISDMDLFHEVWTEGHPLVLQAPSLAAICDWIGRGRHTLVVWMLRPLDEILESQRRINWVWEEAERFEYNVSRNDHRPIAAIKLQRWLQQRQVIPNKIEVQYHSLSAHPLWVQDRGGWRLRQWRPDALDESCMIG